MIIAAPVAFVPHKYGVSVGMSLDEVPSAPGAPSGQSGIEFFICAEQSMSDANKIAEAKTIFMREFMV
jgi:hypothetical protein